MQPTGWNGQPPGPTAPPPGWGDHAPGFANPAPTWGASAPTAPGYPGAEDAEDKSQVGWTVATHVVLWGGLLLVAATATYLLRPLARAGLPPELTFTVSTLYQLAPVAIALVLAGRSAQLRLMGAVAGVVVLGLGVFFVFVPGNFDVLWVSRIAAYAFALGAWMVVRRHARFGYALLVPLALLLLLWFPRWGPAPEIVSFLLDQRIRTPLLNNLWNYIPVVVTAVIGLLSSLLRPRPGRSGDALGWAVVGGLGLLLVMAVAATSIGSVSRF